MVAQNRDAAVADVVDDPVALVLAQGRPLVIVIADEIEDGQRVLGQRQQPFVQAGHGRARRRVGMHDA